jgi:PAS domain S-box-containing protein
VAIRTGTPQINQSFQTNPQIDKWRAEALRNGYRTSIALPLRSGTRTFGALTIYSGEADSFDTEEVKLLEELANNLAFGIVTHQLRDTHKQTKKELQHSEEKFKVLVEHLPQKIFLKDLNSTYLSCNENYARDLGIEQGAINGKTDFDFYPRALAERYRADDRRVMDSGKAEELEEPYVVDGMEKFANTIKLPFRDKEGHIVGVLGVFWDITERKHAEIELREKEERLALATAQNGMGIWDWNLQTKEMICDDAMYALYHVRREDSPDTEQAWRAALHPDDHERSILAVEDAIAGIKPFDTEFRVIWPSGEIRHIKALAKVFRDEHGNPVRMLGTNMDITERKMAEARRDQLSEAVKHSAEAIGLADKNNRFIYINPACTRLLGYSLEEVVGKSVDELIGISEDEIIQPKLTLEVAEREGAFRGETFRRAKDGRTVAVSLSVSAVRDQFGRCTGYVANLFDITERKKAEAELLRQRSFMRQVIDTDPSLIFVKDASGICVLANRALAEHYGVTTQELIGKHPLEFNPNKEEALAHIEADRRVMKSGKEIVAILPSVRWNGKQCWLLTIKKPLVLPDGSVNVLGIAVDVTEQKRAEIKLAESYQELQRLSSHLENLREDERAKVARDLHDEMGSLLVALKMRVAWLASQLSSAKPLLREEAGHISALVADAIHSMHQTVKELRPNLQEGFGFAATVEDYVGKFQQRTGIECTLTLPDEELDLDANQSVTLFRILQESLNNVAKHSQASEVRIRFIEKNKSLSLLIEDNGVGFDPAVHKDQSFGLLGIRERALMMGGKTRISSAPGKGTRVSVTFVPHESAGSA